MFWPPPYHQPRNGHVGSNMLDTSVSTRRARTARVGAKVGRIVRVLRLIRIVGELELGFRNIAQPKCQTCSRFFKMCLGFIKENDLVLGLEGVRRSWSPVGYERSSDLWMKNTCASSLLVFCCPEVKLFKAFLASSKPKPQPKSPSLEDDLWHP